MEQDETLVLVIEDEPDLADLVRVNLELAGYDVTTAHDGAAGLSKARDEDPAAILLDVMMPVLDGWQVLRALKEDEQLAHIPVVMLTALAEERDLIKGHLQGAVRYVTKPFEMRSLLGAVEDALGEPDEAELARRKERVKTLLTRLAELDSGRSAGRGVRLSRLETAPVREPQPLEPTDAEVERLEALTDKQRHVADRLADGRSARELAEELDVSRSNVYATRKRIARKLGVEPGQVAEETRRLGGGTDAGEDEGAQPTDEQTATA